ncbi:hypothetical protein [Streptomyces sp. NPDC056056]|uniref:hypothetical protein n=1 Tax=Streptomyces sp. NPDC056056 TaxID=3345698 RepID=UPI0035D88A16
MRPVECGTCGNQVLCEKFSMSHTSVQWTAEAGVVCAEFRGRVTEGGSSAGIRTCRALRASIDRAVADGSLMVETLDGAVPGGVRPDDVSDDVSPHGATPARVRADGSALEAADA